MEQVANQLQTLDSHASCHDGCQRRPRPLTYDEKKAAESAFQGAPFNPVWSQAAMQIYEGISAAMIRMEIMWITPPEGDFSD